MSFVMPTIRSPSIARGVQAARDASKVRLVPPHRSIAIEQRSRISSPSRSSGGLSSIQDTWHPIPDRLRAIHGHRRPYSGKGSANTPSNRDSQEHGPPEEAIGRNTQLAQTLAESDTSDLVTELHMPDDPDGVLPSDHLALAILGNSSLVIQRQLEMMNVIMGFEQANRYIIMDGQGQTVGYIAERDHGLGSAMARQLFRTHRSFTTHIFDKNEREVLRIHRPFAYINSRIRIYDPVPDGGYQSTEPTSSLQGVSSSQESVAQVSPLKLEDMRIIGESQQQWAPLRRKYNLFSYRALSPTPVYNRDAARRIESGETPISSTTALTEAQVPDAAIEAGMSQFAHVNEPFLSWDFTLLDEEQRTIGSVNRNFGGFAREIFTDTGVYALRMDSAAQTTAVETADGQEVARYERDATAMTLDQRAVMLATAVSIDFDYFSRHSHAGGGFMPIWIPGGGGTAAEGAAGAGVGAAAGEAGGAVTGAAGAAGRGLGGMAGAEGAAVGAGSIAGAEVLRGRGVQGADDASPVSDYPAENLSSQQMGWDDEDEVWGEGSDPWANGSDGAGGVDPSQAPPSTPSAGGDGEGGGGLWDALSEFFSS